MIIMRNGVFFFGKIFQYQLHSNNNPGNEIGEPCDLKKKSVRRDRNIFIIVLESVSSKFV